MPRSLMKNAAITAAATATLATASPAMAATDIVAPAAEAQTQFAPEFAPAHLIGDMTFDHKRKKRWHRHYDDYDDDDYYERRRYSRGYGEPVYRNTRIWRGRDGRYYCRKENGTTGLLIGGAVGGLIGHEIARDRTLGAILGAAGGALLGREIDRSNTRCR